MATNKRYIAERPSGFGKIFKNEQEIANVRYTLEIGQTMQTSRNRSGRTTPGLKDTTGSINVVDGQVNLGDDKFTLELADGRRWEFFATEGDPVTGSYTVNQSGDSL